MKKQTISFFMDVAEEYAKESPDPKKKVGAILVVSETNTIISGAYNGNPKSLSQERESMEAGKSGYLHAELRALLQCCVQTQYPLTLYCTLTPCKMCCKAIIDSQLVEKVVYKPDSSYDETGLELLKQVNIEVIKYYD